jgi:hypothetical protein
MKFSYLNFEKLVLRGKDPLKLMFIVFDRKIFYHTSLNPSTRGSNPGGIPSFRWIPRPDASNSRRNSIHPVDFHVKDLVIPSGVQFLWEADLHFYDCQHIFMLNFSDVLGI